MGLLRWLRLDTQISSLAKAEWATQAGGLLQNEQNEMFRNHQQNGRQRCAAATRVGLHAITGAIHIDPRISSTSATAIWRVDNNAGWLAPARRLCKVLTALNATTRLRARSFDDAYEHQMCIPLAQK
jgi:hypothetical protein